ncbi:ATP-binding protein [Candidatus Latescibacterota bacterium]
MMTKAIADQISIKYLDMIENFLTNHPEHEDKNYGIVKEPNGDYVRYGDWNTIPTCTGCGQPMSEGIIKNPNGRCNYPYWFCDTDVCRNREAVIARVKKEIFDLEATQPTDEYLDQICDRINIPAAYRNKTISNIKIPDKIKVIEMMKKRENIFISGPVGSGKTHLAIALLIDSGRHRSNQYRFESTPELFNKIQSGINNDTGYTDIIEDLIRYETLVIDDIGSIKNSEHRKEVLFTIISSRHSNVKQTIITTNLSLTDIKNSFDERLASRLSEYTQVKMQGTDHRRNNHK